MQMCSRGNHKSIKFILNKTSFVKEKNKETTKEIDGNNFLVAYDVPIAKTGIQKYSREEIGNKDGDPNEIVNVYRNPEAFKDKELVESFDGIPIVYEHPEDGRVNYANFKEYVVGTVSGVYHKNGDLYAKKLTIIDKQAIYDVLNKETNELSIGFRGTISKKKGTYKGIPYEFEEEVVHANHLALCESGKAGEYYAINSQKKGKNKMDLGNEMEKDCMNEEEEIMNPRLEAHIEQIVKKKMEMVRPKIFDNSESEKEEKYDNEDDDEKEDIMDESKEEKMEMKDSSDPELEKSENKDKNLIHALKNSNKKLNYLLNQKRKEISRLECRITELEDGYSEQYEMMKDMEKIIRSKNLVNAMTGPDQIHPMNYSLDKEMHNSLSKSMLLASGMK